MLRRLRFWWWQMQARWNTSFTGSTITEVDFRTGEVIKVPGIYPSRERSILYRLWATWRAGR